jgi:hypothetical protein
MSELSVLLVTDRSGTNQNAAFCRLTAWPYNSKAYYSEQTNYKTQAANIYHFLDLERGGSGKILPEVMIFGPEGKSSLRVIFCRIPRAKGL